MLRKLDKEFLETLETDSSLDKHLTRLTSQRLWSTIMAFSLAILIMGHVFFLLVTYRNSISPANPFGINIPPPMMLMPAIFFPLLLICAVKAAVAHCEIRTLFIFKKLRDGKSVVTP